MDEYEKAIKRIEEKHENKIRRAEEVAKDHKEAEEIFLRISGSNFILKYITKPVQNYIIESKSLYKNLCTYIFVLFGVYDLYLKLTYWYKNATSKEKFEAITSLSGLLAVLNYIEVIQYVLWFLLVIFVIMILIQIYIFVVKKLKSLINSTLGIQL